MAGNWLSCPHCLLFFLHPEQLPYPTQCPGCQGLLPLPAQDPDDLEWFYIENRQKIGPVKLSRLQELAASGQLLPATMVLEKGTTKWTAAADVPGLFAEATIAAPEAMPYEEPVAAPPAPAPAPPPQPPLVAEAPKAAPRKFLPRWHYLENGQKVGPVGFARLRELADLGQLRREDSLLQQGAESWTLASEVEGLFPAEPPPSPPAPGPSPAPPTVVASPEPEPPVVPPTFVASPAPKSVPEAPSWYFIENKRKAGPVGSERIQELIAAGQLHSGDMLLPKGTAQWLVVQSLSEFAPLFEVVEALPVEEPVEPTPEPAVPEPPAAEVDENVPVADIPLPAAPEAPVAVEPPPVVAVEPPPVVAAEVPAAVSVAEPVAVAVPVEPEPVANGQPVAPVPESAASPLATLAAPAPDLPAVNPDDLVQSFESAWLQGRYPELDGFLPDHPELRQSVLPRLARIDLQCRLNCKEAVRVDAYLERYPDLAANRPAVLDLLTLEYKHRRRGQPGLTPAEYVQRFPHFGDELRERLEQTAPAPAARTTSRPAAPTDAPPAPPSSPKFPQVPDHEITGIVSENSRYIVYRARHCKLNRPAALKLLAGPPADPVERQKQLVEARAAARVHHPHLVEVFEVGELDGRLYWSMEWLEGAQLADKLHGAPLSLQTAVDLVQKLTDALEAAHGQGVVHRQLNPTNIFLSETGQPKLANFGIRKRLEEARTPSDPVAASYTAPEQAEARLTEVGPPTDIHALGAVLYELLTGRPPFRGATSDETLGQVRTQIPPAPSELNGRVPIDLDAICLKCLHKDPYRRYANAQELSADLRRFREGKRVQARSVAPVQPILHFARRYPLTAAILAGLFLLNFIAFAAVYGKYREAQRRLDLSASGSSEADDRAQIAAREAAASAAERQRAEQASAAARAAEAKALTELQQTRERAAKALEQAKLARQHEQQARDDEKKAQADAAQARLALDQAAPQRDRELAERWEKAGQWAAAAYHLGRLIEAQPKDEKLVLRRADAYRQLEHWLPAASDYARALELKPDLPCAEARDRCLLRSLPAQAVGAVGLAATGPFSLPPLLERWPTTP